MITICGTHGSVNFDDSGIRLPDQEDYPEIDRLDVEEFKKFYGFVPESEDILNLGYWTYDGDYEPPETEWRIERMKEAIEMNTPVVNKKCPYCGSTHLVCDASAVWDIRKQEWIMTTLHDCVTCSDCERDEIYPVDVAVFEYEAYDKDGKVISRGFSESHDEETACKILDTHQVCRDKLDHGCWSYEDAFGRGVTFR